MTAASFWAKVDRSGGPDACWPWVGGVNEKGYGRVRLGTTWRRAHRVAYEAVHGPVSEGLVVMHECDNPRCCNPRHLRIGTVADNQADMVAKGRSMRGQPYTGRRRTVPVVRTGVMSAIAQDIDAIENEIAGGMTQASIARRYGVDDNTIRRVRLSASRRRAQLELAGRPGGMPESRHEVGRVPEAPIGASRRSDGVQLDSDRSRARQASPRLPGTPVTSVPVSSAAASRGDAPSFAVALAARPDPLAPGRPPDSPDPG